MDWRERFDREMATADAARAEGNEGRARVCARRAAGIVAVEYYARHERPLQTASAIDVLQELRADGSLPAAALPALDHLLLTVDAEFRLPLGVDLIAEARLLRHQLLPAD